MRVTMYRERSGIWMLQWGGRKDRHYSSTGVKDKALAAAVRERKERELTLAESSPEIALIVREEVQRALSSLPAPTTGASNSPLVPKPARKAAEEYVEFQRGTLGNGKSHVDNVERQIRMFLDFVRVEALCDLNRANLEGYVASVRASGSQGEKSIKDKWSILGKFFRWSIKRKYMTEQIADEDNRPKEPARPIVRVYTAAEALAILDAVQHPEKQHRFSKELAVAYGLALYAGPRRKEIMRLEWPDIDLSGRTIRVINREGDPTKTRRNRFIPLIDQLLPLLVALPRTHVRLFPKWNDPSSLTRKVKDAGVEADVDEAGLQVARHSFVTHLLAHGVSAAVVASWAGHSLQVQERNYNGLTHGLGEPLPLTYCGQKLERHGLPPLIRTSKNATFV